MRTTAVVVGMLLLGLSTSTGVASSGTDTAKTDSKGVTLEDVLRGLKRAEQNVEREIPKIGPAVVHTFNKLIGKESPKQPSQNSERQKK